jgi:hypothetical protein
MSAKYSADYSSSETAYWNEQTKKWEIKGGINCITSVNFFLGYMLKKGGNGYSPKILDNLVNASVRGTGFSDHFGQLQLAFQPGATATLRKIATSGSRYKGADRFPYWEMPFGIGKRAVCRCGLHVSPKYVLENKDKLARVNIASVSLASGKPIGALKRWWRSDEKKTTRPFSDTKLYWEYTVMLVFKIKNKLYTYHHSPQISDRWRKFERQAQEYVRTGNVVQDSLWLIWKLPDKVWQTINPEFFKDSKGVEWHPKLP